MALGNNWTNIASRSVYVAPATITFYIDAKLNRQDISGNYSVVDTRLTSTISGGAAGSGYRFTLTGSNGISGDAVWTFANETISSSDIIPVKDNPVESKITLLIFLSST